MYCCCCLLFFSVIMLTPSSLTIWLYCPQYPEIRGELEKQLCLSVSLLVDVASREGIALSLGGWWQGWFRFKLHSGYLPPPHLLQAASLILPGLSRYLCFFPLPVTISLDEALIKTHFVLMSGWPEVVAYVIIFSWALLRVVLIDSLFSDQLFLLWIFVECLICEVYFNIQCWRDIGPLRSQWLWTEQFFLILWHVDTVSPMGALVFLVKLMFLRLCLFLRLCTPS